MVAVDQGPVVVEAGVSGDRGEDAFAGVRAADQLLRAWPLIDGHNDLPWAIREGSGDSLDLRDVAAGCPGLQTDLPRLRQGHLSGQFWSVYVPCSWEGARAVVGTLEQIDIVHRMIARYPDDFALATSAEDVERHFDQGRIACLLGAEGGHSINSSMGALRALFGMGVRYLTLTHNRNTPWADSATDRPHCGGLTAFGRAVVGEMQRIGMLVDLSHVAVPTMQAALDVSRAPVIFSHSSARALCEHPRNVPDEILIQLARNHGLCMVTFVPEFVSSACRDWTLEVSAAMAAEGLAPGDSTTFTAFLKSWTVGHPRPEATLANVADHVDHVREVAGVEHVGVGGDFDGTPHMPKGLGDVAGYPRLIQELLDRGWSEGECRALVGGNILRVLREAESVARHLLHTEAPSV
ncbi:MAG: dipeptidase, partial [Candidatus Dormibacteria bacterium]